MITVMKRNDYSDKAVSNDPITERIIACCFNVHKELGPGFNERI